MNDELVWCCIAAKVCITDDSVDSVRLEINRRLRCQTAFDRPGALVGEHLTRASLQGVEGDGDDALRGNFDHVQSVGQVGIDEAYVQPKNLRSLLPQFVAQAIGQTPCCCFGESVGVHGSAVDPTGGG